MKKTGFSKKNLIIIAGPTAAGKSAVGVEVAECLGTEILSIDARQAYKDLCIGVDRPPAKLLARVPHHGIGHYALHEKISAGRFEEEGLKLLEQLFLTHDHVVGVGGSGFYVKALCEGLPCLPSIPPDTHQKWQQIAEETPEILQQYVQEKDPVYYAKADTLNLRRLVRAAETMAISGKAYSDFVTQKQRGNRNFQVIYIGLHLPKEVLHQKINQRVEHMLQNGLLEEVKRLLPHEGAPGLSTIGYPEFFAYHKGKITLQEATALMQQNTRQYAKRQMTWFRKNQQITWFSPEELDNIKAYVCQRIKKPYTPSF